MEEYVYSVIEGDEVIAHGMTLRNALTFTKALFEDGYNEKTMAVTIQREDNTCTLVETYAERGVF